MKKITAPLLVLLLAALACNLPGSAPAPTAPPAEQAIDTPAQGEAAPPAPTEIATPTPAPTLEPTPTSIPRFPVSLGEGLASLDTYELVITTRYQGANAGERSETVMQLQQSRPDDAQMVKNTTTVYSQESSTPETSVSTSYQIGLETCSISEDGTEFDTMDPLEKDIASIMNRLMDILPRMEDPQFIAEETVNGVAARHFSFTLSGLGSQSGAEVAANQGDYWLAIDGQYLVKYAYVVELRNSPEQVFRQEYLLELTGSNQPLSISFPPECLAAKGTP